MADSLGAPNFSLNMSLAEDAPIDSDALANRDKLIQAYRAMIVGDNDPFMQLLDPDVTFHQAPGLPFGGEARGVEDTFKLISTMFETWSDVRVDIVDIAVGTDVVIAYLQLENTARATGKNYSGPTSELFRFRDGKIVEWRLMYWDTHGVRQACGLA